MSLKYDSTSAYVAVLNSKYKVNLSQFASENKELNEFLVDDALEYQKLHLGMTYLLISKANEKILSFTTLSMGALKLPEKKDEFIFQGKKLREYPKDFPNQFPALLIGKLATDKDESGRGAASLLVDYAIKLALEEREKIGCAYVVAHAYASKNIIDWYTKRGFKTYIQEIRGRETVPMYFELSS